MYVNTISDNITVIAPAIIGYSVSKKPYPNTKLGIINATNNRINLFSIVLIIFNHSFNRL